MMNPQILSEPASTRRIKANMSLAIDETILTRQISGLQEQLTIVGYNTDQRNRANYIRHELNRLSKKLANIRQAAVELD